MGVELVDTFKFASETVTQTIGLSSAILALSVTFQKEQLAQNFPKALMPLKLSWVLHILSILAGVWSLMAITGQFSSPNVINPNIWVPQITIPVGIQISLFFVAIVALVVAGWKSL